MNKKMRDILSKINSKKELAKSYMDGETKDVEKASAILDEIDALEKEYAIEEGNRMNIPLQNESKDFRLINRKAIIPTDEEILKNHRSKSAKVRAISKK